MICGTRVLCHYQFQELSKHEDSSEEPSQKLQAIAVTRVKSPESEKFDITLALDSRLLALDSRPSILD